MFCRKCGNEIPDDSDFCPKCGERVVTEDIEKTAIKIVRSTGKLEKVDAPATAESGALICKECGKTIPQGNMFCPVCGTDVPNIEIAAAGSPSKKSKLKLILISAGALVAVLAVVFLAVILPEMHLDFYYERDPETGDYIILGTEKDVKDLKLPDTIWFIPVRAINDEAFINSSVESVSFGKNIRYIGMNAFRGCKKLKTVKFSEKYNYDIRNVIIDLMAFRNCSSLKTVLLPNINTEIYDEAFCGCSELSDINLKNVSEICTRAFAACTTLTEIRTDAKLRNRAFEGCYALYSANLHDSNIPERCFESCTSLESVLCSRNARTIQDRAFNNCSNLSAFYVDGVEYNSSGDLEDNDIFADNEAFDGCVLFRSKKAESKHNEKAGTDFIGKNAYELMSSFDSWREGGWYGPCLVFEDSYGALYTYYDFDMPLKGVWYSGDRYLSSDLGKTDFINGDMTVKEVFAVLGTLDFLYNDIEECYYIEFTMYGYRFRLDLYEKSMNSKIRLG